MALTVTIKSIINIGNRWQICGTMALDASYPAGGYAITARKLGLCYIDSLIVGGGDGGGYSYDFDYVASKLKVLTGLKSHTHVLHFQTVAAANAVTAAANSLRTGAAAFDVAGVPDSAGEGGIVNVAASAGAEVTAGVSLAGVTAVRFEAIGV